MTEKRSALLSRSPAFAALLSARALSLVGDGVCNLAVDRVRAGHERDGARRRAAAPRRFAPFAPEPDHRGVLRPGRSAPSACCVRDRAMPAGCRHPRVAPTARNVARAVVPEGDGGDRRRSRGAERGSRARCRLRPHCRERDARWPPPDRRGRRTIARRRPRRDGRCPWCARCRCGLVRHRRDPVAPTPRVAPCASR